MATPCSGVIRYVVNTRTRLPHAIEVTAEMAVGGNLRALLLPPLGIQRVGQRGRFSRGSR